MSEPRQTERAKPPSKKESCEPVEVVIVTHRSSELDEDWTERRQTRAG
jgi:hypothetical protein